MGKFVALIVPPFMALAAMILVFAFPTPQDFRAVVIDAGRNVNPLKVGPVDVPSIVEDAATAAAAVSPEAHLIGDCFEGLDRADQAKLQRCGNVVVGILAQIESAEAVGMIRPDRYRQDSIAARVRLAATEVCRTTWATSLDRVATLDNEVCQVANVQLAAEAMP